MARSAATVTVLVTGFDDADGVDAAELTAAIESAVTTSAASRSATAAGAIAGAFTSASAAITAAVAVQQAAAHLARRPGGFVRVGLAIGEGTDDGQRLVAGAPVDEAIAACAVAAPGEILATELVQLLTAGRARRTRPPVTVDPNLPPMTMVALAWEPRPVDALPPVLAPGSARPRSWAATASCSGCTNDGSTWCRAGAK